MSMRRKGPSRKHFEPPREKKSLRVVRENQPVSVTVTDNVEKKLSKRYVRATAERLKIWFQIANDEVKPPVWLCFAAGDPKPFLLPPNEVSPRLVLYHTDLPSGFFDPLKESLCASFGSLIAKGKDVREREDEIKKQGWSVSTHGPAFLVWKAAGAEFWGDFLVDADRRLKDNPSNLRELFRQALLAKPSAEIDRFSRCPVCHRFFYRVRADEEGGAGCRPSCNNALRQRRLRRKRAEQKRAERNQALALVPHRRGSN